ncbi:MAG: IspD/TarI family cytidylyltransferase [bacterium]
MTKIAAVIVAAGKGVRFKGDVPKGLVKIDKRQMFLYSLFVLQALKDNIDKIILVTPKRYSDKFEQAIKSAGLSTPFAIVDGGKRRQDSVRNALYALDDDAEFVLIHDAARPFLIPSQVKGLIRLAIKHGAATMASQVRDTLRYSKQKSKQNILRQSIDRENLYALGTPQIFRYTDILNGHEKALRRNKSLTDDTSALPSKQDIYVQEVDFFNFKITNPDDIELANAILPVWINRLRKENIQIPHLF